VAIVRDGSVIFPRGDVALRAGDEVLVLAVVDAEDAVRRALIG
jgi:Trk K+ transport system NAD-binding subunit